jgi:hypothetical protein
VKVTTGSTFVGAAARAVEVLVQLEPSDPKDWLASIGTWFIYAPGQSPAWRHYGLSAIHLRPIDGVKPPVIREAGATHEFMLLAMDPRTNPVPHDPQSWSFLRPLNLIEQVALINDAAALRILDMCALEVTKGRLWAEPPLSGIVQPWRSYLQHRAREEGSGA